ncbi:daunorubicin resistance protein DrrA family ABC transporter ATP-binding protein [Asanoa ishikariensis]|uniref:ABC-2 type transport system ATP-binding protein n=1 Tax=Asanoa ishikariensis TaxID=137265 RepID=A0A1H3NKV9_9ACTN|nr:ATP-binding cassette domain-containing protein [Asanoa ishikariensis]GIF68542.1 daunorubicin resistance protein DrrA family ABC transporter ATP-binding protein [Asanoa ishikariensis]SDY89587.1 ABC-2 type transport system ATP-binding protein [Asanoa ishikariensis]
MANAIIAEQLGKTYGSVTAVVGLDLVVPEGTVLGLLGPNGAGKTTTVRMLTTLITPTSGRCEVGGIDVCAHPDRVRRIIGVSGQYAAVDDYLTGQENLEMVGRLYHLGKKRARKRAKELLEQFELTDAADRPAKTYSGGMRRRLDLAGALVVQPPVIFLDEPTTGLDPRSRLGMWGVISDLVKAGSTLLLTTQYLEEADRLCDDIVVIDHGRAIAQGTATELKSQMGGEKLAVAVGDRGELVTAADVLRSVGVDEPEVDDQAREVTVHIERGTAALVEAVRKLDAADITPTNLEIRKPTLDDVFLTLTGQPAQEQTETGGTP